MAGTVIAAVKNTVAVAKVAAPAAKTSLSTAVAAVDDTASIAAKTAAKNTAATAAKTAAGASDDVVSAVTKGIGTTAPAGADDVAATAVVVTEDAEVAVAEVSAEAEAMAKASAEKEIPTVVAIGKGSLKNKLILIPAILILNAISPFIVMTALLFGGLYLALEAAEKVKETFFEEEGEEEKVQKTDQEKIKAAVKTDFIMSLEILLIALGSVEHASMMTKIITVTFIGFFMTFLVYGFVLLIIRLDDMGLALIKKEAKVLKAIGKTMLTAAPKILDVLEVVGTLAMFVIGGGIFAHYFHFHLMFEEGILGFFNEALMGLAVGGIALLVVELAHKLKKH